MVAHIRSDLRISLLLMCAAASSLAVSGFFAKLAMHSVDLYLAVTSRFFIPLVLTASWLRWRGALTQFEGVHLRQSIPRALALCLSQFCLYAAIQMSTLSQATILYNLGPIFITLYSSLRSRSLSGLRVLAVGLGFAGVLCMSGSQGAPAHTRALAVGVLSAFFQAASQILLHRATRKMGTTLVMLYVYLIGSLVWLGYLLVTLHPIALLPGCQTPVWVAVWLLGSALGSLGNQQFRGEAYRRVEDPAVLSPLIYLSIAVSVGLDHLFFQTRLRPEQWLGGALIVAGALVSSREKP